METSSVGQRSHRQRRLEACPRHGAALLNDCIEFMIKMQKPVSHPVQTIMCYNY